MTDTIKKEKPSKAATGKAPRVRGVGNPESYSQDADRQRKTEHRKSDK